MNNAAQQYNGKPFTGQNLGSVSFYPEYPFTREGYSHGRSMQKSFHRDGCSYETMTKMLPLHRGMLGHAYRVNYCVPGKETPMGWIFGPIFVGRHHLSWRYIREGINIL
ncbi:hypothetical protein TNCT_640391 [Trichonephila clavata]|uniref:Uncharacterized protein n=1 Tax=Trichonephila clavata TaxID=2740835 RepID=A0A8X6KCB8_TRICU|nr:hypothetical protein TNCT_640391 [Trichonephila clavata]